MLSDKLRALLMPTLILSIVAALWVTAKTRDMEADAGKSLPAPKLVKQLLERGEAFAANSNDDEQH